MGIMIVAFTEALSDMFTDVGKAMGEAMGQAMGKRLGGRCHLQLAGDLEMMCQIKMEESTTEKSRDRELCD